MIRLSQRLRMMLCVLFYTFNVKTTILSTMQHVSGLQALCCSINLNWLDIKFRDKFFSADSTFPRQNVTACGFSLRFYRRGTVCDVLKRSADLTSGDVIAAIRW